MTHVFALEFCRRKSKNVELYYDCTCNVLAVILNSHSQSTCFNVIINSSEVHIDRTYLANCGKYEKGCADMMCT